MIPYEELRKKDFEEMSVNSFWNTGAEKELKMHRIHAYPAKFPAFITSKSIEYAKSRGVSVKSVADVFCGCGTVAYEARRVGVDFWGCDLNPVATLIANTKSRIYQPARLQRYLELIVSSLEQDSIDDVYRNANPRLKYWYTKRQYNELYRLKSTILEVTTEGSDYQQFFMCAFSNILKPTSRWLAKSIKPQIDPRKKIIRVFPAFIAQSNTMISAVKECRNSNAAKTVIATGNVLSEGIEKPIVDLIVTSPPYVTSYEYADLHQLSTLWLGFADDFRDLREGSIGSVYNEYNFEREVKRLNAVGDEIVFRMYSIDKRKAKAIAKYYLDMQSVARECYSMLSDNGMALFVIGNTEYKGVRIDNARHLSESLKDAGFSAIEITKRKISNKILTPYRDENGRFTSDKSGRKIYSEEFIVVGTK